MGGHSAWRKRLAAGMNAKGMGGAICRHRPHFGRKGKDLVKNRKGNIGGGNPKKVKKRTKGQDIEEDGVNAASGPQSATLVGSAIVLLLGSWLALQVAFLLVSVVARIMGFTRSPKI